VTPILRIGSNPGAMWLYRYYIAKDVDPAEDPSYRAVDYEFIPATIDDNPHVNLEEQELRLNSLPSEALRQMYRDGDWLAVEGQFFTEWRRMHPETGKQWHVIQELPHVNGVPVTDLKWVKVVAVVDWGYDPDPGVCTWFAELPSGRYIAFKEHTFKRTIVPLVAQQLVEESRGLNVVMRIGGHDMWMSDKQIGESMAETFARKGFSMRMADTDRINGWQRLHALMTETVDEGYGPIPKFQVYEPGCPSLARTIPMLQCDPRHIGDLLQQNDHWADTARWFSMSRPSSSSERKKTAWDRLPKDVRARLRGQKHGVLGSESARR
jgi:phage terminase large subunit